MRISRRGWMLGQNGDAAYDGSNARVWFVNVMLAAPVAYRSSSRLLPRFVVTLLT